MKTFSVEGTSALSLEAAMASAMARAGMQGIDAARLEVAVASAVKDVDGVFHVVVNVRAIDANDEAELDDDGEASGESGRAGRDHNRQTRRAARISQMVRDELLRQYHLGVHAPGMDEAYEQGQVVLEATPDTTGYLDTMADGTERGAEPFVVAGPAPSFDAVTETPTPGDDAGAGAGQSRITMLSREVDEVIGLLSLGFYDPPQPAPAAHETAPATPAAPAPETEAERQRRLAAAEGAPMPTQPPAPAQLTPGA